MCKCQYVENGRRVCNNYHTLVPPVKMAAGKATRQFCGAPGHAPPGSLTKTEALKVIEQQKTSGEGAIAPGAAASSDAAPAEVPPALLPPPPPAAAACAPPVEVPRLSESGASRSASRSSTSPGAYAYEFVGSLLPPLMAEPAPAPPLQLPAQQPPVQPTRAPAPAVPVPRDGDNAAAPAVGGLDQPIRGGLPALPKG